MPRFKPKQKLQELGLIIDRFPFYKSWSQIKLQLQVGPSFIKRNIMAWAGCIIIFFSLIAVSSDILVPDRQAPEAHNIYEKFNEKMRRTVNYA